MSVTSVTYFLTGPLAGKSVDLGHVPYRFREGRCVVTAPVEQQALHARFLERNWGALPEGHPDLKSKPAPKKEAPDGKRDLPPSPQPNGQPPVPGDLQPNGEGAAPGGDADNGGGAGAPEGGTSGEGSGGDGQPEGVKDPALQGAVKEPKPLGDAKLTRAVMSLDPADDTHWNRDGRPAMSAVEKMYGSTGITRADVEGAAPGHTRAKAKGEG